MATKYADRAFISVNGTRLQDVQSGSMKQNFNARAVPTMTRNRFNKGFVQGNTDIDINVVLAVQNQLSRPKLDFVDWEQNDGQMTWVAGAEIFICTGLFKKDSEDAAGGVGDEVKATQNFGALTIEDGVGNSVLFALSLVLET